MIFFGNFRKLGWEDRGKEGGRKLGLGLVLFVKDFRTWILFKEILGLRIGFRLLKEAKMVGLERKNYYKLKKL